MDHQEEERRRRRRWKVGEARQGPQGPWPPPPREEEEGLSCLARRPDAGGGPHLKLFGPPRDAEIGCSRPMHEYPRSLLSLSLCACLHVLSPPQKRLMCNPMSHTQLGFGSLPFFLISIEGRPGKALSLSLAVCVLVASLVFAVVSPLSLSRSPPTAKKSRKFPGHQNRKNRC